MTQKSRKREKVFEGFSWKYKTWNMSTLEQIDKKQIEALEAQVYH